MNNITSQKSFSVIGIEARTSNAAEMGPNGIIPKQWEKFMTNNLLERIPHKAESSIIAAYTEYESNKDGEYTFFIGTKVSTIDSVPEGMVAKTIPTAKYLLLTSQTGAIWEVVQGLWKKIWTLSQGEVGSESTRAYGFDYEIYDQRAQDPQQAQIDVYLSLL